MKYMIMLYGSQLDYDVLTGKPVEGRTPWTPEEIGALHAFMGRWNQELLESGELVDGQGLNAPIHTRRVSLEDGVPVVTDGPYAETQEVLAGYTIVECASFDRATEIAARLAGTPRPGHARLDHEWYVDVRPIHDSADEIE